MPDRGIRRRGARESINKGKTTSTLTVWDREISLQVERKKVQRVYLRIGPDFCLRVTIPQETRITAKEIVARKKPWIERKVRELSEMSRVLTQDHVLIHGSEVGIRESPGKRPGVRLQGKTMYIQVPPGDTRERILSERLERMTWELLRRNLPKLARDVGVKYNTLSVRAMKRWGQCSQDGDLRFNSKLVCLPVGVARYVMLHELVHLVCFDHSTRFRRLIRRHCPDHRELERLLKTYLH